MRYVTSAVLAVVVELIILTGLIGMFNSAHVNVVTYPQVLTISLKAVTVPVSEKTASTNLNSKGENGKTKQAPSLSLSDMRLISTLKSFKKPQKPKPAGTSKASKVGPYMAKEKPSMPSSSLAGSFKPAEVNPTLSKTVNPQFVTVNASFLGVYTFSQLVNLGIPNFQTIEGFMKRDYKIALSKLPTAMAYTLGGAVKGIVEVQTDGSVKVQRILSSPSVILTDIYTRNLEKFVTFPRSFALKDIEIEAIFNPSSGTVK